MTPAVHIAVWLLAAAAAVAGGSGCFSPPSSRKAAADVSSTPRIVTLESPSPMISFKVMVRAGSTADPQGKEGLAYLTAESLIQGGFGNPEDPVTKERLAEIVLPWGEGALPTAQVAGRTTTFHFTVPRDVLGDYVERILQPMLLRPLFLADEIERLRGEMAAEIPALRYERLEDLGLTAIDAYVNEGTRYAHPAFGTEKSIPKLSREDTLAFYRAYYQPGNIIIGVSTSDSAVVEPIAGAVRSLTSGPESRPPPETGEPPEIRGRHAVLIEQPQAPAAGVHLGFPIAVGRGHPDFWPLYVANTWLGVHRDSFGRLYRAIRQERGYNYGDYSYIEHWDGKPASLFQIFNQPREHQYFSIWIRPVQREYAVHLAKAATFELERLAREGLSPEEIAEAKTKAKVLYLNLAETVHRLLAARMDDAYYGVSPGFLEGYLDAIDRVTPEELNTAVRRHLRANGMKYLVVTDSAHAGATAAELRDPGVVYGKTFDDYGFEKETLPGGGTVWKVPGEKVDMIRLDAVWAHEPLEIEELRRAPVTELFRGAGFIGNER